MYSAESQKKVNERATVARDAEDLLVLLDTAIEHFPKNLKYSGSHAALVKQFGATMYSKINSMSYCTDDIRARRSYCQAALGDYEALKLEKRLCFRKRGTVEGEDGMKKPNTYYVGKDMAAQIDEKLGSVGRQLVGIKKSLDDTIRRNQQ